MDKILILLALAGLAPAQPSDSGKSAVLAIVHQFVDGFNKGDTKTALAACADQTSIIDEFPPHEWHGPEACTRWMNDYDANARKQGLSDGIVTLSSPLHVDVAGDRAYVVIPANYTLKQNGKPVRETGSTFTFALQKSPAGWRIIGWSWAKH
jgi:ketosteroid isomerase-like protein